MRKMNMRLGIILALLSIGTMPLRAQGLQVSGGIDVRYTDESQPGTSHLRLQGWFLNLRKVWSDNLGDRWIGVAQADLDNNFQDIRPYQVYLQYKGPLGKWNVRAGHYLLPFGLLAQYDTERLVLQGLERTGLGIRKDTGLEVFGHVGRWDYAVSTTAGLSDVRFIDRRANPLITARLAYVRDDWQVGFSTLIGRVLLDPEFEIGSGVVRERRLGLDATKSFGRLTMRAEALGGTNDSHAVGGGILLADYAISPKLELNTRHAYWYKDGGAQFAGLGLSYQIWKRLYGRLADNYQFGKTHKNAIAVQLYYEFSKHF